MHKADTGTDVTEAELAQTFNDISADIKSDDGKARALRAMLLRDWVEEYFEQRHGKPIRQFLDELVAAISPTFTA